MDLSAPQRMLLGYSHGLLAIALLRPRAARVLLGGLGGGAMVHYFAAAMPQAVVDVVEIDPVVAEIARRHFGFASGGQFRLHVMDIIEFVRGCRDTYDVVIVDAPVLDRVNAGALVEGLRACATADGVVVANLGAPPVLPEFEVAFRTTFAEAGLLLLPNAPMNGLIYGCSGVCEAAALCARDWGDHRKAFGFDASAFCDWATLVGGSEAIQTSDPRG